MTTLTTYPLRLPKSIKAAAERLSKADGTSLNQFVATAVAEKIAVMEASAFFEVRAERARAAAARGEPSALLTMLNRTDGEPPRKGDELPESHVPLGDPTLAASKAKPKAGKSRAPVRKAAAKKRT
jgi:hypothetical protein